MASVKFYVDRTIIFLAIIFMFLLTICPYLIAQYLILKSMGISTNIEPILLGQSIVLLGVFIFVITIVWLGISIINMLRTQIDSEGPKEKKKPNKLDSQETKEPTIQVLGSLDPNNK